MNSKSYLENILEEKYPLLNPFHCWHLQKKKKAIGNIFMLHRVCNFDPKRLYPNENMKISPAFLELMIIKYQKRGFDFLSLDEIASCLNNKEECERPFIAFTLDDGYADNYTIAYPIFKKYNIPFTLYISSDFPDKKAILWWYILEDYLLNRNFILLGNGNRFTAGTLEEKSTMFMYIRSLILKLDRNNFVSQLSDLLNDYNFNLHSHVEELSMSWEQISSVSQDPLCTIGGHTASHPVFNTLSESEISTEIEIGCKLLSEHTGKSIEHFAYPYGSPNEIGEREFLLTEKMNFKTIATAYTGTVNQDSNPLRLFRTMLCEL